MNEWFNQSFYQLLYIFICFLLKVITKPDSDVTIHPTSIIKDGLQGDCMIVVNGFVCN